MSNPSKIQPSINNVVDLRRQLLEVFDEVRSGEMKHYTAKELVNAAGKIINSVRLELEYAQMRKEVPEIEFLDRMKPQLSDGVRSLNAKALSLLPEEQIKIS